VEQLIARNRKIAAITHLPNPLTAEQLGTLLCGKRAISAIERTRLNSLLGALKFTPEQLHALRDKTGLSDAQLQSLLIFQTAQLMLFVNQSLPPLTNDPPMGTLDNLTLKLSTLTIRNQFPNFSTALEPSTLEIDSSMSSIDYRSGYRFCSPEPLGRVNWEMAIKLDPDAPTSFRSAVDNNFQVTPVGVGSVAPLAQELRL
jgi:hypothetical protein